MLMNPKRRRIYDAIMLGHRSLHELTERSTQEAPVVLLPG